MLRVRVSLIDRNHGISTVEKDNVIAHRGKIVVSSNWPARQCSFSSWKNCCLKLARGQTGPIVNSVLQVFYTYRNASPKRCLFRIPDDYMLGSLAKTQNQCCLRPNLWPVDLSPLYPSVARIMICSSFRTADFTLRRQSQAVCQLVAPI